MENSIMCGVCFQEFEAETPEVGNSVECSNCEAVGYATYSDNEFMYYMIEWIRWVNNAPVEETLTYKKEK